MPMGGMGQGGRGGPPKMPGMASKFKMAWSN